MTDQQLLSELAARRLGRMFDRSSAIAVHTAAVVARNTWIATLSNFKEAAQNTDDDDICREMAAAVNTLNEMVERSAALLEDKE